MSKNPLCARCYKAPEGDAQRFNYALADGSPICSMRCLNHSETPVEECARLAVQLMRADLMFHMFLSFGREDELGPDSIIQRRRVAIADRIQALELVPEVKEILL